MGALATSRNLACSPSRWRAIARDAGRKFLREHRDIIDEIFDRVREALDETLGGGMDEVNRAVGRFVKEAYRTAWRAEDQSERKRNH